MIRYTTAESEALLQVADGIRRLGVGDGERTHGAIEMVSFALIEASENLQHGLEALADAIRLDRQG